MSTEATAAADNKTLRLAATELTEELLARYLEFEAESHRFLLEHPGDVSGAHRSGIVRTGLDVAVHGRIHAVATAVAGRLVVSEALRSRLPALSQDKRAEVAAELARLETWADLQDRFGRGAVELLLSRKDQVLAAHREGTELLLRGGR